MHQHEKRRFVDTKSKTHLTTEVTAQNCTTKTFFHSLLFRKSLRFSPIWDFSIFLLFRHTKLRFKSRIRDPRRRATVRTLVSARIPSSPVLLLRLPVHTHTMETRPALQQEREKRERHGLVFVPATTKILFIYFSFSSYFSSFPTKFCPFFNFDFEFWILCYCFSWFSTVRILFFDFKPKTKIISIDWNFFPIIDSREFLLFIFFQNFPSIIFSKTFFRDLILKTFNFIFPSFVINEDFFDFIQIYRLKTAQGFFFNYRTCFRVKRTPTRREKRSRFQAVIHSLFSLTSRRRSTWKIITNFDEHRWDHSHGIIRYRVIHTRIAWEFRTHVCEYPRVSFRIKKNRMNQFFLIFVSQ